MAVWTLVLLLAACGAISASANSVDFIEGPVLLPSCSASQTVVRCSIEVDGIVTPRIDFYINGELSRNSRYLRCNSENVRRYELENDSVPKTCTVNNTAGERRRRVHQTMFIRTCPSDPSSFSVIIQCIVYSNMYPAVNGTASNKMNLTYNERQEPRLDPVGNKPVRFLNDPVCPGEDLGRISLESQSSLSPSRCTTSASPIIETPSTTSPLGTQTSVIPTPNSSSPPPLTTSSGPLTEGQLMLIIYIATGVAAFFALLVVCLIFMLCCIVTKKHRMQKAGPLRQGRRDVAHGLSFGLTDNDKVNNRDRGSSSPESAAHQLDLHRGRDSSQSGSIRSSNGDEERSHVRTSVEVRDGHPLVERDVPSSIPNPLSLHREAEAEAALQEHDYDSIDDDWPVPDRREGEVWKGAVRVDTKGRKKNTYVAEYETQPLHLSVSDTASDRSGPFPTTEFGVSSMEQNILYPTSELLGTNTASEPPRKQQDYVNRPAHDYVNDGQQSHDYTNDEHPIGAVYHNSLMFGAQIHDYRNHPQPGSKVQMLMKMDPMTDSYQELNTVGSTSSMTGDPCAQYTTSSHLETFPLDLQRLETCRKASRDTGAATNGSENVYHTLCPSNGDSASSSSSDYSLPRNGAPAAVKSATVGAPVYDRLQAVNGRDSHVPTRKTSAPSAIRDSEYTDLETVNMEQSSDYSTLNSAETVNIGTQTYDTSTA